MPEPRFIHQIQAWNIILLTDFGIQFHHLSSSNARIPPQGTWLGRGRIRLVELFKKSTKDKI